jgi:hypothetical protein
VISEGQMPCGEQESRWHTIYVRKRFESIVAAKLESQVVEHYFPLRQLTNGSTRIELPLFPGILFCKCSASTASTLQTIPGVLAFQTKGANGVAMEQDLAHLQHIMRTGLPIQAWPYSIPPNPVLVDDGVLSGVTGFLENTSRQRLLIVPVHVINRALAVEIDEACTVVSLAAEFGLPVVAS